MRLNSRWRDSQEQMCEDVDGDGLKPILISPPFGSYIHTPYSSSVLGSFTWEQRPGLLPQVLKTLRPTRGGYVNRIGLRNSGILNVTLSPKHIYSVVGMNANEWDNIIDYLPNSLHVEVNVGCPNGWGDFMTKNHSRRFVKKFPSLWLKLPPTITIDALERYVGEGIKKVHLCNTLPTERGGESGRRLREVVLPLITTVKDRFPNLEIIAGGGIYSFQDALDYQQAGATSFSLSTVWFNPVRAFLLTRKLSQFITQLGVQPIHQSDSILGEKNAI